VGTLALSQLAFANTYRPNKLGDHAPGACTKGDCTLREAVIAANLRSGADVILLRRGKHYNLARPGTIEDAAADGDLDITDSLTVKRAKPRTRRQRRQRATVDANLIEGVFQTVGAFNTTFNGLVVIGGKASNGRDGGIDVDDGRATVLNSVIRGNVGDDDGGIGSNSAALIVRRSRVVGNSTPGGDVGGIDGNGDSLTVVRSVIARNTGDSNGGGLYVSGSGFVNKSTIQNNESTSEDGGGIYDSGAPLTVLNSTIAENKAEDGGGIGTSSAALNVVTLRNSTIANNATTAEGGGINLPGGDLTLNNATVARNLSAGEAGGIWIGGGVDTAIGNSIIALNTSTLGGGQANCSGIFVSTGHNLSGDASCGFGGPGDFVNANPKLGFLRNNGGPTETLALLRGSPAINKGGANAEPRDQRGVKHVNKRDIGAFEFVPKG
jgi:CSLREA domain-containing protein